MGVHVEYIVLIGVKKDFYWLDSYKDKNQFIKNGESTEFKNIVFEDYFSPNMVVYQDGMCCEYSIIGRCLVHTEYLDEIPDVSFTSQELQKNIDEVYDELINLGVKDFSKEDVKLHIFCHFS